MGNNKLNKDKIILISSIVLSVVIILLAIFIPKNSKLTPDEITNQELLNYIGGEAVKPYQYVSMMINADKVTSSKAGHIEYLYGRDETFKLYKDYIGKEFINEFQITSTSGEVVTVKGGNKKIIVFTDTEVDNFKDMISDYLYLGARAKDAGMYEIYVVNTDNNTFKEYINNNMGHMLNAPTAEITEFLQKMPDNFALYLDNSNIIECITALKDSSAISETAAYIFSGNTEAYKMVRLMDTYYADAEAASIEYARILQNRNNVLKEFTSIVDVNSQLGYNFYTVDQDLVLNDGVLELTKLSTINNNILVTELKNKTSGRTYTIKQKYDVTTSYILDEYKYNSHEMVNDVSVNFYGNNSAEIYQFVFSKDNILIYVSSSEPWNIFEMKQIVGNF